MKATLYLDIEFNDNITDAESIAFALDKLLKTALSTPDILEEYGEPKFGEFFEFPSEELQLAVRSLEEIQGQLDGLVDAVPVLRRLV